MTDRDPIWDALKSHKKEKFDSDREKFLIDAMSKNDGLWKMHTEFHWSRFVNGRRLDYWPSRKKFQYLGKTMRGDVLKFIKSKEEIK